MVEPIRHIRRLIVFLVVSGSLNIILVSLLFYLYFNERPPTPYFESKPVDIAQERTNLSAVHSDSKVISYFRRMPLQWLISRLNNTQLVENGFTQRDLALASLIAFHSFDVERAFAGLAPPSQRRTIIYGTYRDGRPAELVVYPGLSDAYFDAAVSFATTERWPLTSRGLFLALQREEREDYDMSLQDAFFMTQEFAAFGMLFNRSDVAVEKGELLRMMLEANWDIVSNFARQQKASHDLSPERRKALLLELVKGRSKAAARLLLKTDGPYAARMLNDAQVIALLELLDGKSVEGEAFALAMLESPRSDAVRKLAATRLYEYAGERLPEGYTHQGAVARFIRKDQPPAKAAPAMPRTAPLAEAKSIPPPRNAALDVPSPVRKPVALTPAPAPSKKDRYYTVQEGDSLWKIARRFGVDIDTLRHSNRLDSDVLRPGKMLKIPSQ